MLPQIFFDTEIFSALQDIGLTRSEAVIGASNPDITAKQLPCVYEALQTVNHEQTEFTVFVRCCSQGGFLNWQFVTDLPDWTPEKDVRARMVTGRAAQLFVARYRAEGGTQILEERRF